VKAVKQDWLPAAAHQTAWCPGLLAHPPLGKSDRQPIERQQLAHKSLGGRHTHLDSAADIHEIANQPLQLALRKVDDPQQPRRLGGINEQLAPLLLHRQRRHRVCRLARLGDPSHERVSAKQLVPQASTWIRSAPRIEVIIQRQHHQRSTTACSLWQKARYEQRRRFRVLMDLLEH
jgi:hypothetical protein